MCQLLIPLDLEKLLHGLFYLGSYNRTLTKGPSRGINCTLEGLEKTLNISRTGKLTERRFDVYLGVFIQAWIVREYLRKKYNLLVYKHAWNRWNFLNDSKQVSFGKIKDILCCLYNELDLIWKIWSAGSPNLKGLLCVMNEKCALSQGNQGE